MRNHVSKKVLKLEQILDVCDAAPRGDDLPQVPNTRDIIQHVTNSASI